MNVRSTRARLFLLIAIAISTAILYGQATDAILVGTVTDTSSAAVAGANITATNRDTGVKYTSVTNVEGQYRLNNIPVGTYSVSAAKTGFATATTGGVELQLNHTTAINLTLRSGQRHHHCRSIGGGGGHRHLHGAIADHLRLARGGRSGDGFHFEGDQRIGNLQSEPALGRCHYVRRRRPGYRSECGGPAAGQQRLQHRRRDER